MNIYYGKIKNGQLLLADTIVTRFGKIIIDDEELYLKCGYKRIVYTTPPKNKETYDLVSTWEERNDSIVQVWKYKRIQGDRSADMFIAIRNFICKSNELKLQVKNNYCENIVKIHEMIDNDEIIRLIYKYKPQELNAYQLLEILHESTNLQEFFEKIGIVSQLEENSYHVTPNVVFHLAEENISYKTNEKSESQNTKNKKMTDRNPINIFYLKPRLSALSELESYKTISNTTMYSMAYIYLFTAFDEILLKMIRIICIHEKKWLISDSKLSAAEILKSNTLDDMHILLVENKINQLAWESYDVKMNFLYERGISIDEEHKELFYETILYLSKKRNILVHNNGVWNQSAVMALKNTKYHEKLSNDMDVDYSLSSFEEAVDKFVNAIKYLYERMCEKFNFLNVLDFEEWVITGDDKEAHLL